MGNCCQTSKPNPSETVIVHNNTKPSKNGLDNLGFIDVNLHVNPDEKVVGGDTKTKQNESTNVARVDCNKESPVKENNIEEKSFVVPIIVVEKVNDVDLPSQHSVEESGNQNNSTPKSELKVISSKNDIKEDFLTSNTSTSSALHNVNEKINEDQTCMVKKKESLDSAFSDDDTNSEDDQCSTTSSINLQSKIYQEIQSADCKRIASHLQNMEDHIQNLGCLIDRFDGVFVKILHDEIEGNLRCCHQNVSEIECFQYKFLRRRQKYIQIKIKKYLDLLDAKSEK